MEKHNKYAEKVIENLENNPNRMGVIFKANNNFPERVVWHNGQSFKSVNSLNQSGRWRREGDIIGSPTYDRNTNTINYTIKQENRDGEKEEQEGYLKVEDRDQEKLKKELNNNQGTSEIVDLSNIPIGRAIKNTY